MTIKLNNPVNVENFIKDMKKKYPSFGFGISPDKHKELCQTYNFNLINFLFPTYSVENEKNTIFHIKESQGIVNMEKDWLKIKSYLDKVMEDISFINISLEDYYGKIKFEFFEYKHISKEDIILTYNETK